MMSLMLFGGLTYDGKRGGGYLPFSWADIQPQFANNSIATNMITSLRMFWIFRFLLFLFPLPLWERVRVRGKKQSGTSPHSSLPSRERRLSDYVICFATLLSFLFRCRIKILVSPSLDFLHQLGECFPRILRIFLVFSRRVDSWQIWHPVLAEHIVRVAVTRRQCA